MLAFFSFCSEKLSVRGQSKLSAAWEIIAFLENKLVGGKIIARSLSQQHTNTNTAE
jgi:hypothetical protein